MPTKRSIASISGLDVITPELSRTALRRAWRILTRSGSWMLPITICMLLAACWWLSWWLLLSHLAAAVLGYAVSRWQPSPAGAAMAGQPAPIHSGSHARSGCNDWLQQLPQSEQVLRDLVVLAQEGAELGVWNIDLATRIYACDDNMRRLLGISGQLDLEVVRRCVHPEDRVVVDGEFKRVLEDRGSNDLVTVRHRIIKPNRAVSHLATHGRVIRGPDGLAVRIQGVTRDVTAEVERAAQAERQAQHEQILLDRLGVAVKAAGISVWEMDLRTHQFLWLENPNRALGLEQMPLERIAAALAAMIDPADLQQMLQLGRAAIDSGEQTYSCRFRAIRHGNTRHMQAYAHIVRDPHGRALRLIGATSDITNEVQTHDLFQRQAEQGQALLERLTMATRAAGIDFWEIDLRTQMLQQLHDPAAVHECERIPLARLHALQHPEDRSTFDAAMIAARQSGADVVSYRQRVRDGSGWLHRQSYARLILAADGEPVRALGLTWDVTKEAVAAERLEAQAKHERILLDRFSMATQTANICSWEVDLRTRRFSWADNPIRTINGLQDLTGNLDSFFARVHPEDRVAHRQLLRDAVRRRDSFLSWCYRDVGESGEVAHIQTHARIIYDEQGAPLTLLGVSWDVTAAIASAEKLKQQAQQLEDAQRRLERASLSSSEGHWETDVVQQRLWFSSSYYALLGYREGELVTASDALFDLVHPHDLYAVQQAHQLHIEHGAAFCVDVRMRTAGSEYRWFRQRGTAERDGQGRASRMAGSIQDIHQQKLAEDALHLAQQRLQRAINGTQDGLWEQETSGGAWCSPRVAELLGYTADELPSDTDFLRLRLHPDDSKVLASATRQHYEYDVPCEAEIRLLTKQGDYRWYRVRAASERNGVDRLQRLSGSLQDVTEARAAREALLRATEAAQAASRAKSDFLANVSHEIRTPMNGILGMTGLLLDTLLDRTQHDYASCIRSSADSLLAVINDILDFSKIEAGKLELEAIEFDLPDSVEAVAATLAVQAAAKQLELVVDVAPELQGRVVGDPQRVRQCLLNLVGNAVKFTQAGEVVIEVRQVESGSSTLTRFEVRDTGIGIGPTTLSTLFQPFVQADSSTTRHFGGTGLGLSIVRRLVEMMGGAVGVASELGRGSRFWFELPLLAAGVAQRLPTTSFAAQRVLLAQANATARQVLAARLRHAGYEVESSSDGVAALQCLRAAAQRQLPFQVVLADAHLPGLAGVELVMRLAAEPALAGCRVVLLAEVGAPLPSIDSALFAGCLNKPVRGRELFKSVQRALEYRSGEWHLQTQTLVKRPAAASDKSFAGRVLLVEDNIVNQKVAVRFLERLGCEVVVVDNGANAVKAYREKSYDLILMDLQMPVMDGLAATRCIRDLEAPGSRIPIVALTANAMPGQEQLCAAAGMDGFLTKPLEPARLQAALSKHGFDKARSIQVVPKHTAVIAPCVDLHKLRELTEDDAQFMRELTATFNASGAQVMRELQAALADSDAVKVARAAHKLKGAAANVHAVPLAALAERLEAQAVSLEIAAARALIEQLTNEFLRATRFLEEQCRAGLAGVG